MVGTEPKCSSRPEGAVCSGAGEVAKKEFRSLPHGSLPTSEQGQWG